MDSPCFDVLVPSNGGTRRPLAGGLGFGLLWRPMITGARIKAQDAEERAESAAEAFGCLDRSFTTNDHREES